MPLVCKESWPVYYPRSPWPGHQYVNHPGLPGAVLTSQGGGHGAKLHCTHGKLSSSVLSTSLDPPATEKYCTQYFTLLTKNVPALYSVLHYTHFCQQSTVFTECWVILHSVLHCTPGTLSSSVVSTSLSVQVHAGVVRVTVRDMPAGVPARGEIVHNMVEIEIGRYPSIEASSLPGTRRCFVPSAAGWGSSANGHCQFSQRPTQIVMLSWQLSIENKHVVKLTVDI